MPPRFQTTRPMSERKQDRDEVGRKQLEKMQQAKMMPQPEAHSESNDQHDAEQKMQESPQTDQHEKTRVPVEAAAATAGGAKNEDTRSSGGSGGVAGLLGGIPESDKVNDFLQRATQSSMYQGRYGWKGSPKNGSGAMYPSDSEQSGWEDSDSEAAFTPVTKGAPQPRSAGSSGSGGARRSNNPSQKTQQHASPRRPPPSTAPPHRASVSPRRSDLSLASNAGNARDNGNVGNAGSGSGAKKKTGEAISIEKENHQQMVSELRDVMDLVRASPRTLLLADISLPHAVYSSMFRTCARHLLVFTHTYARNANTNANIGSVT